MKVVVQDTATLRALKPLELAAYLRAKGWRQEADLNGKGSLWLLKSPGGAEFDVTLPAKRELGDYVLRVAEVLQTLANAEERSQLDVLRDVQTTSADLVRVRAPSRDAENGTLPLDQAVAFVERSRDMMLAAACAAIDKRPFYAKRKAQQAMDHLSHLRMGQTERGSYVLTILSPVPPELRPAQGTLLPVEPEDPYERLVTRTLMGALKALEGAARDAAVEGNMAPFQAAVSRGVSANLCDAVVGLSAVSPGEGLDIQVSWSRTRPVDNDTPSKVTLGSDSIPLIEEAARQFRETASLEDVDVEGVVTRLDRGPAASEGDVTITGSVDGQMRRITLRLGSDTYRHAIQAHDERRTVRCTGELVKEGRGYRLKDPRHFEIIAVDDASE
ncbi:hypothetical protein NKH81_14360 [Mesorhizobium sp. M0959]|uniref:hypothetical protein n=1 Tax=Mesorhizobium sp. M0959 TaxID=2957034 RepID=UPI0033375C6D